MKDLDFKHGRVLSDGSPGWRFALYGSLRQGMSNRPAFDHGITTLRVMEIGGFEMYALENYPFVVPTGNAENRITVELVEISSMAEVKRLCEFEFSVGYELADVLIDGHQAGIFIFSAEQAAAFSKPEKLIRGGDWVRFAGTKGSHA